MLFSQCILDGRECLTDSSSPRAQQRCINLPELDWKLANTPTHIPNYLQASSLWAEGLETPSGMDWVTWLILTSLRSWEWSLDVSATTQSFQWGNPTNDFLSLHKWKWQAPPITVNICLLSANRPSVVPGVYLWLQNWICSCLRAGNQSVHKPVQWSHQRSLKHHSGNFTITVDRTQGALWYFIDSNNIGK